MKKQMLGIVGGASIAILALAVMSQVWVSAQTRAEEERGLDGTWNLQVTLRDCDSGFPFVTFPAMNTYNQGGTTLQSAVPGPEGPATPGHGAWKHETGRNYSGAFQFFIPNANPTLTVRVIVRSSISLDPGSQSYSSTDTSEIYNLNGDLLSRGCSTTLGTRFK